MTAAYFIDPAPGIPAQYADLFRDYGLEAYSIIHAIQQQQDAEEAEYFAWEAAMGWNRDYEDGDEEIDLGYLEPDDYGD